MVKSNFQPFRGYAGTQTQTEFRQKFEFSSGLLLKLKQPSWDSSSILQTAEENRDSNCGRHWSSSEDLALAKSYIGASMNPLKGTDQNSETIWGQVHANFRKIHPKSLRALQACKNRWSSINRDVQKFFGLLSHVQNLNESGNTLELQIEADLAAFAKSNKKTFKFLHCWQIMMVYPKWEVGITKKLPGK
jgi:hypothetical protein